MPDDSFDARIAAAEARTDTKLAQHRGQTEVRFVQIEGKLDLVLQAVSQVRAVVDAQRVEAASDRTALRSEASSNRNAIVTTVLGTGLGIVALMAAIVSVGASAWYNGTVLRDAVHSELQSAAPPPSRAGQ